MTDWWKQSVFYQIYMPSFCDGNNDGIGDLKGLCSKLEYLKKLGVGGIWLTPFYPSPKVDQGYDISDYENIDPDYGTMEDFEQFLEHAHKLGIRVIADMVINHTSTKHPWFLESASSRDNPKRNWYVWRNSAKGKEPNNWMSFFGESAWEYQEQTGMYYYHSFAKEQADLNWANPEVKQAIWGMLRRWVEKGIDGFRLDVINNLTLTEDMPDNPVDSQGNQVHQYDVNQPGIHEFMREIGTYLHSLNPELFLVGEISSDKLELIHSYACDGQLDTTFNFNLGSIETFDFNRIFRNAAEMASQYSETEYPTIFFGSHDMPRAAERFHFTEEQLKVLITLEMTFRAIPFLYQGDELGMKNFVCHTITDARDIQGILAYRRAVAEGKEESEAIDILNRASRDHSRNSIYWDDSTFGGFSNTEPWIGYQKQPGMPASEQVLDPASVFACAAELVRLRSREEVLIHGTCVMTSPGPGVILCERVLHDKRITAVLNFNHTEEVVSVNGNDKKLMFMTRDHCAAVKGNQVILEGESAVLISQSEDVSSEF